MIQILVLENDLQNHWAIRPRASRRNWKSPVFSLLEMLVLGKFRGLPNALLRNILGWLKVLLTMVTLLNTAGPSAERLPWLSKNMGSSISAILTKAVVQKMSRLCRHFWRSASLIKFCINGGLVCLGSRKLGACFWLWFLSLS